MSPFVRRFFALLPLGCLPLAHATSVENLIFLTDLDDSDPLDQVAYQTEPTMGKWIGFDAFTGHQNGSMYTSATLDWTQFFDECNSSEDGDGDGTFTLSIAADGVFSSISTEESPLGAGLWFRVPPPDSITQNKAKTTDDQVCGSCPDDGISITRSATAELSGNASFNGSASEKLPNDPRFSRESDVLCTAYQTNVELRQHNRVYSAQVCDGTQAGQYKFQVSDYRWGRQTARFRVKGKCPGKYTLYYSIGEYQPLYYRFDAPPPAGDFYWTTGAKIKIDRRQTMQRKKIDVTIGEDGWMVEEAFPLPTPPLPTSESWGPGVGYELITRPEQAEAYGINLDRDAHGDPNLNIWKDYAVVLEPLDCGCAGNPGGGGGGAGSGGPRHASINFDVNLGYLSTGQSAGHLSLRSATVTPGLLVPSALELVASAALGWAGEVQAVSVGNVLRQIRAPQTFVDIVSTSSTSYEIRFYAAGAGGVYDPQNPVATPSGTPQTTWTIGPGTVPGSVVFTRGASVWEFRNTTGGGTEMLRNGIDETRETTSANGTLVETRKTIDPVYGFVAYTRKAWRMENGQPTKIEDVQMDASGNVLRGLVDDPLYGPTYQVDDQTVYWPASGSSEGTYYFDGSGDERYSSTSTIGDLDGDQKGEQLTESRTESLPDYHKDYTHVIAYSAIFAHDGVNYKKEETRQARTPASYNWDSPGKRITTSWTFADGSNAGKTAWEFNPDGSALRWIYSTDANGNSVTVKETGTPDETQTAILYGTRSTTVEDTQGRLVSSEERDIATALVFSSETVLARHPVHGTPTMIDRNGVVETREYSDCCGRLEKVTRQGLVRTILYDGLDREAGEEIYTSATPAVFVSGKRNELDALNRIRKTYQRLANGAERLIATADYDLVGTLTGTWSLQDGTVGYSETVDDSGQWVKTSTRAESATGAGDALDEVTISTGSGLPLEFRRNGVLITKWSYGPADEGYSLTEIKVGENDSESEYVRTVSDLFGEQLRVEYPFPQDAHAENEYDEGGRLVRQTDPDGVQTLFAYERDAEGEHVITALDMNQDGEINYGASGADADRITKTTTTYGTRDSLAVRKTITTQWIDDGDTPQVVSVEESAADGSADWQTRLGTQTTRSVIATDEQTGLRTETLTLPDKTQGIRTSLGDSVQSEVRKDASGTTVSSKSYQYDTYGRTWKITDARGTTTLAYSSTDRLQTVTTPDPGTGALVTTYGYNNRGAVTSITYPDTKTAERLYWPDGSLKHAWGARTYPEYRTYDRQGRLKTLTTWQAYTPASHSGTGAAVTSWNYHNQRGWLENKRYQDDKGPDYAYTAAGRPSTRTWARTVGGAALVATYGYDHAGELNSIDYSDGTPDVTHVYDRAGRLLTTTDAAGILTRSYYADSLQLYSEAYTGSGLLSGRSLVRTYDPRFRAQSLVTDGGYAVGYGYDSAGRLAQVNEGFHTATFGYENGTSAHNRTTVKRVGVERVRSEKVYDAVGRIDLTRTIVGGSIGVLRDYTLNAAGQRTGVELEDGRRWAYGYDDLGQVTSAQKRLADNTTSLPGYTFGYSFDDIGNRIQTVSNARTNTYTPDLLNRYTSRQVAGAVDVRGEAATDAAVSITTTTQGTPQSPARTGKDFYRELSYTNTSAAVSNTATITATRSGPPVQSATEQRVLFLPQTPESFGYDDDGNLTADGRWTYTWDAENRLIGMETKTSIATAFPGLKQKLEFAYDAQSRRIRKLVKSWDAAANGGAGGWATVTDLRFVYDGWNLIAEYAWNTSTSTFSLNSSYAWGLDLSGSRQGAGGVGGLLWANTTAHTFAAGSDGNGNIVAWVNTANLAFAGRADYSPFGEPVMRTGVANNLPFGFSTKYTDSETGFAYYGFRFYNPSTGRWPNRDPMHERGGLNVYGMVENNAINKWDHLGLFWSPAGPLEVPPDDGSYIPPSPGTQAFINWVANGPADATNKIARRFLALYMQGFTDPNKLNLTPDEFGDVIGGIDLRGKQEFIALVAKSNAGISKVQNLYISHYARTGHTVGRTLLVLNGDLCKLSDGWKFDGSVSMQDRYDFDTNWVASLKTTFLNEPGGRTLTAEAQTEIGSWIPGDKKGFLVIGGPEPLKQISNDVAAQWIGAKYAPVDALEIF